jgi:hypothetical protein
VKPPHYENAIVPRAKIIEYLLSPTHRDGRSKAAFFTRYGFSVDRWEELAAALLRHAAGHAIAKTEDSPFGARYSIEGGLSTPDERVPVTRSVWFIETGEPIPRFVTAYPLPRRST